MRRFTLAALAAGLLAPTSASAATYYVATTGSNARSCATAQTIGTPKQTLNSAVACLGPGDTLLVRGGTYNESLSNNIPSGTSWASKVRIAAYPGTGVGTETVTVTPNPCGSDAVIIMGNTGTGIFKYIELDGINLDASACAFYAIKLYALSASDEAHHIRVQNAEIQGLNNAGSCGGITSINCGTLILHASGYTAATGASEFINLTLHRSASSPSTVRTEGFYIQTPDNVIEHCDISNLIGWGIQFWNENVPGSVPANNIARYNKIHDFPAAVGALHIAGIVTGLGNANKIYNNLVYGLLNVSGPGISVYADTNAAVYNNTVYGGANDGIIVDGGSTGAIIRNNIAFGNSGSNYNNISSAGTTHDHNVDSGTDPVFVNAGAHDFHLQSTSPAIDTGSSSVFAGIVDDYDGNSRPQGAAWDIGAYEFLASVAGTSLAFINRCDGGNTASASTLSSTACSHLAGSLLVAMSYHDPGVTISSVANTAGDTWTQAGSTLTTLDGSKIDIYYAMNSIGNAADVVTWTYSGAVVYRAFSVLQFSGAATTSALITAPAGSTGTSTSAATSSLSISQNAVICAFGLFDAGAAVTVGSGYTGTNFAITGDAATYFFSEYKIVTTGQTATATGTSSNWAIQAAAFKEATAATTRRSSGMLLRGVGGGEMR
jgi:hypothetical protein